MPRQSRPIGPDTLSLIEDARVDLLAAVLAAREGENEPEFKLPSNIPDLNDDDAVDWVPYGHGAGMGRQHGSSRLAQGHQTCRFVHARESSV